MQLDCVGAEKYFLEFGKITSGMWFLELVLAPSQGNNFRASECLQTNLEQKEVCEGEKGGKTEVPNLCGSENSLSAHK